jgi:hypothetical protein
LGSRTFQCLAVSNRADRAAAAGSKPTARRKSNQLKWFKKWDTMDLNAFSAFDYWAAGHFNVWR